MCIMMHWHALMPLAQKLWLPCKAWQVSPGVIETLEQIMLSQCVAPSADAFHPRAERAPQGARLDGPQQMQRSKDFPSALSAAHPAEERGEMPIEKPDPTPSSTAFSIADAIAICWTSLSEKGKGLCSCNWSREGFNSFRPAIQIFFLVTSNSQSGEQPQTKCKYHCRWYDSELTC